MNIFISRENQHIQFEKLSHNWNILPISYYSISLFLTLFFSPSGFLSLSFCYSVSMSLCLPVFLPLFRSLGFVRECLSLCHSDSLSVLASVSLSQLLFLCLSGLVCKCEWLSLLLFLCLFVSFSLSLSLSLLICLSFNLSLFLSPFPPCHSFSRSFVIFLSLYPSIQ